MNIPSLSMSMSNQNPNRNKYSFKNLKKENDKKPASLGNDVEFADDEITLDINI